MARSASMTKRRGTGNTLCGRHEPIGDAFDGADFSVPSGKEEVPGLAAALKDK